MGRVYDPAVEIDGILCEIEREVTYRAEHERCWMCIHSRIAGSDAFVSDNLPKDIEIGYCPRVGAFLAEPDHPIDYDCLEWE